MNSTAAIISNTYNTEMICRENDFEKQYLACRKKENRIYTDDEVTQLPACSPQHPHYAEWRVRKKTSQKLYSYINALQKPISILEIGCGNGWLSHRLSGISGTNITGLDINQPEIIQAARVFGNTTNLRFIYGDLRSRIVPEHKFDIIVFAASIQYFQLHEILAETLLYLKSDGEIHLTDSPFYKSNSVATAKNATRNYYNSLGFPAMADHYFHHTLESLTYYDYDVLYKPNALLNRLTDHPIPFHWIRIRNKY